MARQRNQQAGRGLSGTISVLAVAAAVVLVGLTAIFLLPRPGGSSPAAPSQERQPAAWSGFVPPDYVLSAPDDVQTAYQFALERPDVMMWMPCYCGCGQHSDHKSARNCFVKDDTTSGEPFDPHGAGCAMCVGIALDVKALTEEGRSLRDIRAFIDEKYGSLGGGTDTPLPPA
jgi:hypothetical protein